MVDIDKYAEDYSVNSFEEVKVFYRRKKMLEIMPHANWGRVLEIGCGLDPLFKYVNFDSYCVVEPSKKFYDVAVKEAKNDKIECVNDFFGIDTVLRHDTFDCIICSGLLHEVDSPEKILKGIYRYCNEDTIIHVNVPNAKSIHRLLGKAMGLIKDEHELSEKGILFQQNRVFDMNSLKKLVKQEGFEIVKEGSYFVKPFSHDQMKAILDAGFIDQKVLDGLYRLSDVIPEYGSEIYLNLKKR